MSSNKSQVLNELPSLLGGMRNNLTSSEVSVERAKLGLQYRMKAAKASSSVSSDTSRGGGERSSGRQVGVGCLERRAGDMAENCGEAFEGVEGVWELRVMSP